MKVSNKNGTGIGNALLCSFLPIICNARCPAGSFAVPGGNVASDPRTQGKNCVVITPSDNTGFSCVVCKEKPGCHLDEYSCPEGTTFDAARCMCVKVPPKPPSPGPSASSGQAEPGACVAGCTGLLSSFVSACPRVWDGDWRGAGYSSPPCVAETNIQTGRVTLAVGIEEHWVDWTSAAGYPNTCGPGTRAAVLRRRTISSRQPLGIDAATGVIRTSEANPATVTTYSGLCCVPTGSSVGTVKTQPLRGGDAPATEDGTRGRTCYMRR